MDRMARARMQSEPSSRSLNSALVSSSSSLLAVNRPRALSRTSKCDYVMPNLNWLAIAGLDITQLKPAINMGSPTSTSPDPDLSKQNALRTNEFHIVSPRQTPKRDRAPTPSLTNIIIVRSYWSLRLARPRLLTDIALRSCIVHHLRIRRTIHDTPSSFGPNMPAP